MMQIITDFSSATMEASKLELHSASAEGIKKIKETKKSCLRRFLYLEKISFSSEDKISTFSDKGRLKIVCHW